MKQERGLYLLVLYLGVSDTPAWVISKANQYARDHGLAQFVRPSHLADKSALRCVNAQASGPLPRPMVRQGT